MPNISNPTASPTQKPAKPFPAWYLRRGTINAADAELESSIDACEWWEWFGGGLVVVGVAAAVAIAAIHPKYDSFLEQWGSAIADGLVAIGVAVEIKFGQMAGLRQGELQKRSKDRLSQVEFDNGFLQESTAKANERTARAELELAKVRRDIDVRRVDACAFNKAMEGIPPQIVRLSISDDARDGIFLAMSIQSELRNLGWTVSDDISVLKSRFVGGPHGTGIVIRTSVPSPNPEAPANRIMVAFRSAVSGDFSGVSMDRDVPKDELWITVYPR